MSEAHNIENIVKVTGGWVEDINGLTWLMNRFGVVTSLEEGPFLSGVLGNDWRSMKSSDYKTSRAFQDAILELGFTKKFDGRDNVYSQVCKGIEVTRSKNTAKEELVKRLKEIGKYN